MQYTVQGNYYSFGLPWMKPDLVDPTDDINC